MIPFSLAGDEASLEELSLQLAVRHWSRYGTSLVPLNSLSNVIAVIAR